MNSNPPCDKLVANVSVNWVKVDGETQSAEISVSSQLGLLTLSQVATEY